MLLDLVRADSLEWIKRFTVDTQELEFSALADLLRVVQAALSQRDIRQEISRDWSTETKRQESVFI